MLNKKNTGFYHVCTNIWVLCLTGHFQCSQRAMVGTEIPQRTTWENICEIARVEQDGVDALCYTDIAKHGTQYQLCS